MTITPMEERRSHCDALQTGLLSDRALIIASSRGPVGFEAAEDGGFVSHRSGGGLVSALLGMCRHTDATWIACAQNEADAAWRKGDVSQDDAATALHLRFLSPTPDMYDGYYNQISNPLLWFLQHSMWDVPRTPIIDQATWRAWNNGYVPVNDLFAEAIADQVLAAGRHALVMLQDYHLYLTPRLLRSRLSRSRLPRSQRPTLMHFVHIPWPGPEYWRILPPTMRQAILDGLCAVDLLGFQTHEDALNFTRTCESLLPGSHVNFKHGRLWYRNHATYVRHFPISIDVAALRQLAGSQEVASHRSAIESIVGDCQMILRIDRIEPSKNITRGFKAFEEMLALHPEHVGKVQFLAVLVPSRLAVNEYQSYLDELMAAAGHVNAHYGTSSWEPVRLLVGEDYARAVAALQIYDVLLINAIADGMNLVAKEGPIVNERDGVLILSERAGAGNNWNTAPPSSHLVMCTRQQKPCIRPCACRPKSERCVLRVFVR